MYRLLYMHRRSRLSQYEALKEMMSMRTTHAAFALFALAFAASCSGDDWEIAPGSADDPRSEALRRRLDVTIVQGRT